MAQGVYWIYQRCWPKLRFVIRKPCRGDNLRLGYQIRNVSVSNKSWTGIHRSMAESQKRLFGFLKIRTFISQTLHLGGRKQLLTIGMTHFRTSLVDYTMSFDWASSLTHAEGLSVQSLPIMRGFPDWCTGSWGTQILNGTKKVQKSASWGKCQLVEVPVGGLVLVGGQNLTLGRTNFFLFCRR